MKTFFTVLTALLSIFCINAQNFSDLAVENQFPDDAKALEVYQAAVDRQLDPATQASKITWMANDLASNWFLSLEGGLAFLGSENTSRVDIKDNLNATGGLALGKWFNPVLGARLNLSGEKLSTYAIPGNTTWYIGENHPGLSGQSSAQSFAIDNGTNPGFFNNRFYKDGEAYKNGYLCDFTHGAASVDLMFNLKNLFKPYNPNAFFNPVLYAGIGYSHTFKDGDRTAINQIMQRYGLQFNFRLAKQLDLYLAPEIMALPEVFDRKVGGNLTQDFVASVKIGLTYSFGFNRFIKAPMGGQTVVAAQPDMSQINALNARINDLQARLAECLASPAPVVASVAQPIELTPVFFELNRFVVRNSEMASIERAVNYMNENPDVKLVLAGFADVKTGTPSHNLSLSKNRVNAVADLLVKQYGIDKNRIMLMYKGDTVQPMPVNDDNRVVLFFK